MSISLLYYKRQTLLFVHILFFFFFSRKPLGKIPFCLTLLLVRFVTCVLFDFVSLFLDILRQLNFLNTTCLFLKNCKEFEDLNKMRFFFFFPFLFIYLLLLFFFISLSFS
jgi:hypothetical protein